MSHKILRRLFRPNEEEVRNEWRKLHKEVFHKHCSPPYIIRAIILKKGLRYVLHTPTLERK